jgi:hypothetical protein
MSAVEAIRAARAAGVDIAIDGNDLLLEASAPPPAGVLDLLSRHKADIVALLEAAAFEGSNNSVRSTAPKCESVTRSSLAEPGSQEPCAARRGRVVEEGGALLHFCIQCGRFGSFGLGVSLRRGQMGRWYCREHRPQRP